MIMFSRTTIIRVLHDRGFTHYPEKKLQPVNERYNHLLQTKTTVAYPRKDQSIVRKYAHKHTRAYTVTRAVPTTIRLTETVRPGS